jgi:hypothetical protein
MIYEATYNVKVPSFVAYTPDGSAVRYGVLTEVIGEADQRPKHCILTDISNGRRHVIDPEDVDQFSCDDYYRLKHGQTWTSEVIAKTKKGLIGTVEDIRCISPYPGLKIILRLLSGRRLEEPVDEFERFVGHMSVPLDYERLVK